MTPQQLLEEVKGRFIILFHSDESALTALLRQSLGKFQEKAGIIFSVSAESATIPLPPDYPAYPRQNTSWRLGLPRVPYQYRRGQREKMGRIPHCRIQKAEFLGAHKLPSKTFNAQGTDTVVDVVVFRKHGADFLTSVGETPFEVLKATKVVWEPFVKGDYWKGGGKPFIMGRYLP